MWVNFELCLSPPRTQQRGSYIIFIKQSVVLIVLLSFYFSLSEPRVKIFRFMVKKISLLNIRHRNIVQFVLVGALPVLGQRSHANIHNTIVKWSN